MYYKKMAKSILLISIVKKYTIRKRTAVQTLNILK